MVLGVSVVYFKRKLLRTVIVSFDTLCNLFLQKKKTTKNKQKKPTCLLGSSTLKNNQSLLKTEEFRPLFYYITI